jgi:hypothetical protein
MDVRSCERRDHSREAHVLAGESGLYVLRAPPKHASAEVCFRLTKTYMEVGHPDRTHLAVDRSAVVAMWRVIRFQFPKARARRLCRSGEKWVLRGERYALIVNA